MWEKRSCPRLARAPLLLAPCCCCVARTPDRAPLPLPQLLPLPLLGETAAGASRVRPRTIDFEERNASRTRAQPFLPLPLPGGPPPRTRVCAAFFPTPHIYSDRSTQSNPTQTHARTHA
eukprot:gene22112-biopygen23688